MLLFAACVAQPRPLHAVCVPLDASPCLLVSIGSGMLIAAAVHRHPAVALQPPLASSSCNPAAALSRGRGGLECLHKAQRQAGESNGRPTGGNYWCGMRQWKGGEAWVGGQARAAPAGGPLWRRRQTGNSIGERVSSGRCGVAAIGGSQAARKADGRGQGRGGSVHRGVLVLAQAQRTNKQTHKQTKRSGITGACIVLPATGAGNKSRAVGWRVGKNEGCWRREVQAERGRPVQRRQQRLRALRVLRLLRVLRRRVHRCIRLGRLARLQRSSSSQLLWRLALQG